MEFLVSVIVPVYNTEEYLPKCIESILNQTYKNIEVILVDDGSTDGSLAVCRHYEKMDPRVIVLSETHQGGVNARKEGVNRAQGEYCTFVDSDDWVAENFIETVLMLTDNGSVDIVNYNMRRVDGLKTWDWEYTVPEGVYEGLQLGDIYGNMMFDFKRWCPGIIQSLCTKLIRRDILWKAISPVDSRITFGDDAAAVYPAMLMAEKIAVTYECLYFYRTRPGSLTYSTDLQLFTRIYYFRQYMESAYSGYGRKYGLEEQLRAYLVPFIQRGISDSFSLCLSCPYRVPFRLMHDMGGKIVLYGAGNVGKSYYRQLAQAEGVEIVAWVDKKVGMVYGCRIESPDILKDIDFDQVLIAVKRSEMADEIRGQLNGIVSREQILWEEPKVDSWEAEIV